VEQAAARPRARDIPARCREANVDLVRFLYCGNDSVIRGKASHTRFLNSFMRSGIGLTVAMQSFNMLDQLVPDASLRPLTRIRSIDALPLAPSAFQATIGADSPQRRVSE